MIKMFDRTRRLRVLLAVLVMASLTIITIDFRTDGDGPLDRVGRGALTVIGPIQSGLARVFKPVGNFFAGFTKVPALRDRIVALERELATLRTEREQIADITRENQSLRRLLALRDRFGFDTVAAQVIGVSPSNFERTIFIDVGRPDGVTRDTPVIAGEGLIGRVVSVGESSSRVVLLTDRSSSVAARLAATGKTGVLEGDGTGLLRMELFDPQTEVAVGDKVVTSGYDRGLYPPGIPLGTVVDAPDAGTGLTRVVRVEPTVDFSSLDYVLLVVGDDSGGARRGGRR